MRKSRQVSERGIGKGSTPQPPTPVAKVQAPDSAAKSDSTPSQEAPARKKLKLSVRKPSSNDGDTIAVSRPKRASTIPRRYSEDVFVSDNDKEINVAPSPADSSELSSLDSPPKPVEDDPVESRRKSKMAQYGSFMDYYVLDDGKADEEDDPMIIDDEPRPESGESQPATPVLTENSGKQHTGKTEHATQKRSKKQQQQIKQPAAHGPQPVAGRQPTAHIDLTSSSTPVRHPPAGIPVNHAPNDMPHLSDLPPGSLPPQVRMQQHPRPIPPPPPIPQPDPPVMEEITVKYHAPISEMVANVWALCTALANVGGVAPAKPPHDPTPQQPKKEDKVGGFLSLFDDDSDSKSEPEADKASQEYLEKQGEPDSPLTYGIQFIMNALKSWAQTRLYQQQVAAFQAIHNHAHHTAGSSGAPPPTLQPPVFKIDLDNTPEGKAIAAFRRVVESGCLQLNVRMPQQLSDAVCHLYMQIDKLINQQGNRGQAEYQPMSYSAQINANRVRVAKWREQEAHMFYQHQQMMQQMAMHPQQNGQWQGPHPQDPMAHHNGRRRSRSHRSHRSSHGLPGSAGPSPSPMNAGQGGRFPTPRSQTGTPVQGQLPPNFPPSGDGHPPNGANLTKMQIYTAALPMSGQKMKFSFMPDNQQAYEEALRAFGPEAFPKGLPPGAGMALAPLPSNERPPSAGGHHARPRSSRGSVQAPEGHAHPVAPAGFTPVNQPLANGASASPAVRTGETKGRRESSSRRKSLPESTSQTPASAASATPDLAARYPHPGAVVIDE